MATNPYHHIPYPDRKAINCRVDVADVIYIERLYPMLTGLQDKILSTLFHRFIQHLKQLELTNNEPIEPAWTVGHPSYVLFDLLLERANFTDIADVIQRHADRRTTGTASGSDVAPTTDGVRPKVRRAPKLLADPPRHANKRSGSKPRSEKETPKKG